jgi:hypothetical protein
MRYASFTESDALTFPSCNSSNITAEFAALPIPERAVSESHARCFSPYLLFLVSGWRIQHASSLRPLVLPFSSHYFSPKGLGAYMQRIRSRNGLAGRCGRGSLDS